MSRVGKLARLSRQERLGKDARGGAWPGEDERGRQGRAWCC